MTILCWDVKGANTPERWLDVSKVARASKCSFVALIKTKIHQSNLSFYDKYWDCWCSRSDNTNYHSKCRILIYKSIEVWDGHVISMSKQHIGTIMYNKASGELICTVVYAANHELKENSYGISLEKEANKFNIPWVIFGDFNCLID